MADYQHSATEEPVVTPGQRAAEAIREGEALLADPMADEYHERLSAAIENMRAELSFWDQLRAVQDVVDIANETF